MTQKAFTREEFQTHWKGKVLFSVSQTYGDSYHAIFNPGCVNGMFASGQTPQAAVEAVLNKARAVRDSLAAEIAEVDA